MNIKKLATLSTQYAKPEPYLQPVPVTHSGKRALITLPHTLRRKCAPLKVLACKKALYVNKALKNSLYSHKEPFCVGDERRKQGRGSGGKAAGGRAYFSTGNGYNRVPCPHRHVALTDIT